MRMRILGRETRRAKAPKQVWLVFTSFIEIQFTYYKIHNSVAVHTSCHCHHSGTFSPLRIETVTALFTIAKKWKQPTHPSTNEWIHKMRCIHAMGHRSAIKRKGVSMRAMAWPNLQNIILRERSRSERIAYCTIQFLWNTQTRETHKDRKQWVVAWDERLSEPMLKSSPGWTVHFRGTDGSLESGELGSSFPRGHRKWGQEVFLGGLSFHMCQGNLSFERTYLLTWQSV